ncbi:MAG: hypothetical protein HY287_09750 [Planctomycetes bacterium]|nr:hypothetical protein [Planctomycetota bacterium]MBI3834597.1 hypothetical protein [Planctomycetota bacterium]
MMRIRKLNLGLVACLLVSFCHFAMSRAQEKPKPPTAESAGSAASTQPDAAKQEKPKTPDAKDQSPKTAATKQANDLTADMPLRRDASSPSDYANRRIVQLRRLLKALKEGIQLSPDQVKELDRRFEEYFQYCRDGKYNIKIDSMPSHHDPRLPKDLLDLYVAVEKAEKGSDLNEIQRAREALNNYLSTSPPIAPTRDQRFIGEIGALLRPNQIEAFTAIDYRWGRLNTRLPRDDSLRRLGRALQDPDLKASEELNEKLRLIILEARQSLGKPGEQKPELVDPAAAKAKDKAFALLTPEQRKIVDQDLEMFKEDDVVFAKAMGSANSEKQSKEPAPNAKQEPAASPTPGDSKVEPVKAPTPADSPKPQKD